MDYCISCYVHIKQEEEKKRHDQEMKQRRLVEEERKKVEKEYKEKEMKAELQRRETLRKEREYGQARQEELRKRAREDAIGGKMREENIRRGGPHGTAQTPPNIMVRPERVRAERTTFAQGYEYGNTATGVSSSNVRENMLEKKMVPGKAGRKNMNPKDNEPSWKKQKDRLDSSDAKQANDDNSEAEANYGKAAADWLRKKMKRDKEEKDKEQKRQMDKKKKQNYHSKNKQIEDDLSVAGKVEKKKPDMSWLTAGQASSPETQKIQVSAIAGERIAAPIKEEEEKKAVRRKIGTDVGRVQSEKEEPGDESLPFLEEGELALKSEKSQPQSIGYGTKNHEIAFIGENRSDRKVTVEMKVSITDTSNNRIACAISPREHTFLAGETEKFSVKFDVPPEAAGALALVTQLVENAIYIDRVALQSKKVILRLKLENGARAGQNGTEKEQPDGAPKTENPEPLE